MSTETIQEGLCTRADFSVTISEEIRGIDKVLPPVRAVRQLSKDQSVFDHTTFAALSFDDLANLTVKLVNQLLEVKSVLKDARSVLDDIDPIITSVPSPDSTPQLATEISEMKTTLDNFVNNKPGALDFSKVMAEPGNERLNSDKPKVQPLTTQQSIDLSRSNNVMIYNAPYDDPSAKFCAENFLQGCGIALYDRYKDSIVDAQFIGEVPADTLPESRCSMRVVMSNPWAVRAMLNDAHLLKTDKTTPRAYKTTYIKPDRSFSDLLLNASRSLPIPLNVLKEVVKHKFENSAGVFGLIHNLHRLKCQLKHPKQVLNYGLFSRK